ncbi:unnamed protein product [Protopolystoma xenopodis]|uniref:Uncharacterized protein n=1 Tax=Protopolystoma xenopodis TaxID=117903 RepID=A0A448WYS7_9PLAT|nr:unnamed protein product [Protopolystoma xenopodis]
MSPLKTFPGRLTGQIPGSIFSSCFICHRGNKVLYHNIYILSKVVVPLYQNQGTSFFSVSINRLRVLKLGRNAVSVDPNRPIHHCQPTGVNERPPGSINLHWNRLEIDKEQLMSLSKCFSGIAGSGMQGLHVGAPQAIDCLSSKLAGHMHLISSLGSSPSCRASGRNR